MSKATGKPRGRPRGVLGLPYRAWTAQERAILREAERVGEKAKELEARGVLPGRNAVQIQCQLGAMRQRDRGLCTCGTPLGKGEKSCRGCKDRDLALQRKYLRAGLCYACGTDRTGGSVTRCVRCLGKQRVSHGTIGLRGKGRMRNYWPFSKASTLLGGWVDWRGDRVVDLFGGLGRVTRGAKEAGHRVEVYNDFHPVLVGFMRLLRERALEDVWKGLGMLKAEFSSEGEMRAKYEEVLGRGRVGMSERDAALFYLRHLMDWEEGVPTYKKFWGRFLQIKQGMEGVKVSCKDFREVVESFDAPDVVFLADPCWPGSEGVYEYTIEGRHRELIEVLQKAQGHYILTGQSSDAMMRAMVGVPYLYWLYIGGWKEIIGASFPLRDERLRRFDPAEYGYR